MVDVETIIEIANDCLDDAHIQMGSAQRQLIRELLKIRLTYLLREPPTPTDEQLKTIGWSDYGNPPV
jgi:hypothetical protein